MIVGSNDALKQARIAIEEANTIMHVETRMGEYALEHTTVGCLVRACRLLTAAVEMLKEELDARS